MWLKCSLCSKNCFFSLLPAIFFEFPITRTPDNSNLFRLPWKVRVIGSQLYGICSLFTGKCNVSVPPGWGICPLFHAPPWGFWVNRPAPPWGICSFSKKMTNARGKRGDGHAWNWINHYWPSRRSKWLYIGQVPLSVFIDRVEANRQPSWSNKPGQ